MSVTMFDVGNCGCSCNSAGGVICVTCAPATIPTTLHITDSLGSYVATWNSTYSYWTTGPLCSGSVSGIMACSGGNATCVGSGGSGGALYTYFLYCSSSGYMYIQRYYYFADCSVISFNGYQYAPCSCIPPGGGSYSDATVPVTCGAVAWSGNLTTHSASLPDPVSSLAVSFTQ